VWEHTKEESCHAIKGNINSGNSSKRKNDDKKRRTPGKDRSCPLYSPVFFFFVLSGKSIKKSNKKKRSADVMPLSTKMRGFSSLLCLCGVTQCVDSKKKIEIKSAITSRWRQYS
jgi:hypothetical protein